MVRLGLGPGEGPAAEAETCASVGLYCSDISTHLLPLQRTQGPRPERFLEVRG